MAKDLEDYVGRLTAEEGVEMFRLCWDNMSEESRVAAVDHLKTNGLGDYVDLE